MQRLAPDIERSSPSGNSGKYLKTKVHLIDSNLAGELGTPKMASFCCISEPREWVPILP